MRESLKRDVVAIDLGLYPQDFLTKLGAAGGFGALVERRFGGTAAGATEILESIEETSAVCVTTGFLVWCQSACCWYLQNSANEELRERMLPRIVSGELKAGTGLSNPVKAASGLESLRLKAERSTEGYVLDGVLSWVSNMGPDHYMAVGAAVEGSDEPVFVLVHGSAPGVHLSGEARFVALEGSKTVAMRFERVHVGRESVIAEPGADFLARIKARFVLLQVGMALGLVRACIEMIEGASASNNGANAFLDVSGAEVSAGCAQLRSEAYRLAASPDGGIAHLRAVLALRAFASELSLRAASAAMLHVGAKGYLQRHPAQRRLREAYFIAIVTPSLKHLRKELAWMSPHASSS